MKSSDEGTEQNRRTKKAYRLLVTREKERERHIQGVAGHQSSAHQSFDTAISL